jgi:hypothetical protein
MTCVSAPRCKRTLSLPAYDVRFVLTRIKAGLRVGAKIGHSFPGHSGSAGAALAGPRLAAAEVALVVDVVAVADG